VRPPSPRRALAAALAAGALAACAAAAAHAAPVTPRAGAFTGVVAAGYSSPQITFTVRAGRVTLLVARMFHRCNGGPLTQTVIAPSGGYRIGPNGTFSGRTTESIAGIASETVWFSGRFTGRNSATGSIRSQTVGGGETCDTLQRRFRATHR